MARKPQRRIEVHRIINADDADVHHEFDDEHHENDDEEHILLSPRARRAGAEQLVFGNKTATYGTVHAQEGNTRNQRMTFSGGEEALLLRREMGRRGGGKHGLEQHPKPGSPDFHVWRARLLLLLVFVLHRVSNTSGTVDLQYMHSRFSDVYFNQSSTSSGASGKPEVSKCDSNSSDHAKSVDDALQKSLSRFQMYLSYASIGPMFLSVIFFGSISDVVGRRLLILMPMFTAIFCQLLTIFIIRFHLDLHVMFIGSILGSTVGSGLVMLIGIYAYTADITPKTETRTIAIIVVELANTLCGVVSNIAIGYMIENLGYFYSSLLPFAFKVLSAYLAFYFLPETVPQQVRGIRPSCSNPLKYLKNLVGFFFFWGSKRRRVLFSLCMGNMFLLFTVTLKVGLIWTIVVLDQPFCFSPVTLGYFSAVTGTIIAILGLIALKLLQRWFRDEVIMVMGLASHVAGMIITGFARHVNTLYIASAVGLLFHCVFGINRSLLSRMAGPEKQGALFATVAIVETSSDFLANTLVNAVYQATLSIMRGMVFIIMGSLASICIVIMIIFIILSRNENLDTPQQAVTPPDPPPQRSSADSSV